MEWWKLLLSVVGLDRNDVNGHGESIKTADLVAERRAEVEHPPNDDCCPICFDKYSAACRAPCGHWYCGACILRYWNYGAELKPCKCPLCSQKVTCLMPEPTIDRSRYSEVLTSVQDYNSLFVGGINGLILKVRKSPLLLKWFFREMVNPDAADNNLLKARIFATLLGALYTLSPLDFLPGK
ncbi:E3 ubiquitin-protein ligase RNF170-like isoform X2 [Impatiens glandulifera]|uniref:E3 ubiquitin-protein ligase RNF170-like isoform X2 n=1 Tax=Impatiens glandulifera TaxID=253017 RepID=UPI001FB11DEA|nr:E3 ubiquitin-protein ligase RNF170-like isoform X2 [Impatiens glandulifera]XP_047333639.1 E3 ubiquitin-protein ligase RNF170-like isoform X2 [Impatiens glandulifera]